MGQDEAQFVGRQRAIATDKAHREKCWGKRARRFSGRGIPININPIPLRSWTTRRSTCPWCTSVWAGLFNTSILVVFPRVGRYVLMVVAASGMSELLDPVFPLVNDLSGFIHDS